jgi:NitT/TauT family transport system ATP-binding protein
MRPPSITKTSDRLASLDSRSSPAGHGAVRIVDVSVRFASGSKELVALDRVNLEIEPGEFVALLGPSGCGKSTLLNTIAGFQLPDRGSVEVDGAPVREPSAERPVVFQQHSLFPWMTALGNIAFGLRMLARENPLPIARAYLELVGLAEYANYYPRQLSGGMQQRVGLARALAVEPKLLLMDEPFGALDAQTRILMQEQLLTIWEQQRQTLVFVTHDIDEAIFLADRVLVMGIKPNRIRDSFPVILRRPRGTNLRSTSDYQRLHAQLFSLIREESLKSFTAAKR